MAVAGIPALMEPKRSGDLLEDAVDPKTQVTYTRAYELFENRLRNSGKESIQTLHATGQLEDEATQYVQHLYEQWQQDPANKKGPSGASDFLCSLQHKIPKARGHLKVAWRALTSWQDKCPTLHRRAWPIILVLAMSSLAMAVDHLDLAVAYLINFVTLARPGEMSAFTLGDWFLQQQLGDYCKELGILTVRFPKTRRRAARLQHVLVENVRLLALIQQYLSTLGVIDATPLYPCYRRYREDTLRLLVFLLGPKHGFSLHGLRGGGATAHYLRYKDVLRLMRLGRWSDEKTLNTYVQEQTSLLGLMGWSASQLATVQKWASRTDPQLADFE